MAQNVKNGRTEQQEENYWFLGYTKKAVPKTELKIGTQRGIWIAGLETRPKKFAEGGVCTLKRADDVSLSRIKACARGASLRR